MLVAREFFLKNLEPTVFSDIYEGESYENLKSAIKIRNTARWSCKLTTMILMV